MANEWLEINANDFLFPILVFSFVTWLILLSKMQRSGYLDKLNATKALGFILMLRTQKGKKLLEKISKPRKFWRIYGEVSLWVCRISMIFIIIMLLLVILIFILTGPTKDPMPISTMIAVPGLNPVIPLGWGIFAFIISLVIHEFGHGLQARAHGMRLRSFGLLLLGPLPLGAFAEPEYDELTRAPRKERQRMFAAGPSTNIFLAIICFFILVLSANQFTAINPGMHAQGIVQHEQSGAESAGLNAYDIIIKIDNYSITTYQSFESAMDEYSAGDNVSLTVIPINNNDEAILLNVTLGDAYEYNYYNWNLSSGKDLNNDGIIDKVDFDKYLDDNQDFLEQINRTVEPGDAFLGVSGIVSSTNGIDKLAGPFAPNSQGTIMGKTVSVPFHFLSLLSAPFENKGTAINSFEEEMIVAKENGFSGFIGTIGMILIVESCFWLLWVNILLGLTNLIPILPFDGGHMFKDMMHGTIEKMNRIRKSLGFSKWHPLSVENFVRKVSGWSSLGLFFMLILMIVLPYLVA